ncbi:hypothetical protein [Luteirhabdus pelagi]|uniref:hypothetical protein n=1 Tax=Luteirhabdus pelagi TaxID=2792783 RepID=UPI001939888F|nr:hypothetical protein [Luteirhabdus pelagi]
MKQIFTWFFFIAFIQNSSACICELFWNDWNEQQMIDVINYSDVIFIGELKARADDCYEFEIIEIFNGSLKKGEIVTGYYVTSCSDMPYRNGEYLIYGDYKIIDYEIFLDYSLCSPSRNISDLETEQEIDYLTKELKFLNECFDKEITTKR